MVNVGEKAKVQRRAVAQGRMRVSTKVIDAIRTGTGPKGSVFAVATIAAIGAVKKTPDLIPLCHQVPVDVVEVDFEIDGNAGEVICNAEVGTDYKTGVEMEALVGVHIGLATVYDMCKAIDKDMEVLSIRLLSKTKGKRG